jgi:hypothetical protein
MSPLAEWGTFYVIAGTAAATLTGLMFVVLTLIVGTVGRVARGGLGVYSTPTVVHFAATLVLTVLLSAPWPARGQAGLALGLVGLVGLFYSGIVTRRSVVAAHQESYRPVLEDWLCHSILPPVGYAAVIVAAFLLPDYPTLALFDVGAVIVLFLILGIHNAWDIVTYIIAQGPPRVERGDTPLAAAPTPPPIREELGALAPLNGGDE